MSQTQVLMYGWELPPHHSGGLGEACYGLTKGLTGLGAKVTFVLPRKLPVSVPFMDVMFDELPAVDAIALNSLMKAYMTEWGYQKIIQEGQEKLDLKVQGKTIYDEAVRFGHLGGGWATRIPHDVIHVHDWLTYPAGMTAKAISRKPLVAHMHATEYDRAGDRGDSRIMEIEHQGLNAADKVLCVSEFTKNIVINKYGINGDKIDVVHNGINTSEFPDVDVSTLVPNQKVVLYVGRLTYSKGVEYFLRSAKKILEYEPDAVFVIVGGGDMERQLILQAALLGIGHKVIFTGWVKDKIQRSALFRRADVFVMPSVSEPFGLVALEALACGKPIIISKQSGVAEVIKNSLKVNFWDTDELSNQVVSLLRYPEMAQMLVEKGNQEMSYLTWDRAAAKTMAVYQQLIAGNY